MAMTHPLLLMFAAVLATPASAFLPPALPLDGAAIHNVQSGPRVVVLGADEAGGRRIATGTGERLQVLFAEGTTVSLGPGSEMTIRSFSYDAESGEARLSATLSRGVFRFIGGRSARTPDGVTLSTPFGTVVIDRAAADVSLGSDGQPPHFDLVTGNAMTLFRDGSAAARVRKPGYSIAPSDGTATVRKTPPEWRSAILNQS